MITQINGLFPGELYPDAVVGGCIDIFENAWPNPLETIQVIECFAYCRQANETLWRINFDDVVFVFLNRYVFLLNFWKCVHHNVVFQIGIQNQCIWISVAIQSVCKRIF